MDRCSASYVRTGRLSNSSLEGQMHTTAEGASMEKRQIEHYPTEEIPTLSVRQTTLCHQQETAKADETSTKTP